MYSDWYTKAQYQLGVMYGEGQGVPQDMDKAFHWSLLAANQGFAGAQYDVGCASTHHLHI
jgi:TPR repeat protein